MAPSLPPNEWFLHHPSGSQKLALFRAISLTISLLWIPLSHLQWAELVKPALENFPNIRSLHGPEISSGKRQTTALEHRPAEPSLHSQRGRKQGPHRNKNKSCKCNGLRCTTCNYSNMSNYIINNLSESYSTRITLWQFNVAIENCHKQNIISVPIQKGYFP